MLVISEKAKVHTHWGYRYSSNIIAKCVLRIVFRFFSILGLEVMIHLRCCVVGCNSLDKFSCNWRQGLEIIAHLGMFRGMIAEQLDNFED